MTRSRRRIALLVGLALVPLIAGIVWLGKPAGGRLSILDGVKPNEVRPAEATGRFRRSIYYVNVPYEQVVVAASKDLSSWNTFGEGVMGVTEFSARPGPLQSHPMRISLRKNKCDPDTFTVLGKPADSKSWTTVVVLEGKMDSNPVRSIWHWLTGTP
jgi:hypothetical protein